MHWRKKRGLSRLWLKFTTLAVERLHVLFSPIWCQSLSKPNFFSKNKLIGFV
jgi:hypothetical protein